MKLFARLASLLALLGCSRGPSEVPKGKNPDDAGRSLRNMILTTKPEDAGMAPDADFPDVYGVVCDWNIGDQVASIVSMKDGMASLYTTSTFGIIGGEGHETVRTAARSYVAAAGRYSERAVAVSDYPYPDPGKVNFYLLTYRGVRLLVGDIDKINTGEDESRPLFAAAQNVLTELRLISETTQ